MKIILVLLILLSLSVPVMAAPAEWQSVGIVTNYSAIKVIDQVDYYRLNFDFTDNKGTYSWTALCPLLVVPSEVVPYNYGSKYQIKLIKSGNDWVVNTFKLVKENPSPPISIEAYIPISMQINNNAQGDDWTVYIDYGINTPPLWVVASACKFLTGEVNLDQLNLRLNTQVQRTAEEWIQTNQIPEVLSPTQRVEIVNNKTYLVNILAFLGVHIYSLDNLSTPENEFSITAIWSVNPLPDHWW